MNNLDKGEIVSEIIEWIEINDCRSISIVYRYAEVKYKHWLDVLKDRERYRGIKFYIKSRNYGQRAKKIKAPEGMTLYKKGGGILNPTSICFRVHKSNNTMKLHALPTSPDRWRCYDGGNFQ